MVHVVMRRDHRHPRPLQSHLNIPCRGGVPRAQPVEHLASGPDADAARTGLQRRNRLFVDRGRDDDALALLPRLRGAWRRKAEQRDLLVVLLEGDLQVGQLAVGGIDSDLDFCRGADELFGFRDFDAGRRHAPANNPGATSGEHEDQDQCEEKTHALIIDD